MRLKKVLLAFLMVAFIQNNFAMGKEHKCIEYLSDHFDTCYSADRRGHPCLLLANCNISDKDIPELLAYIHKKEYIPMLDLTNNNITSVGAAQLATYDRFIDVKLDNNHIGDEGAIAFSKEYGLNVFSATNNGIGDAGIAALAKRGLGVLNIADNHFGKKALAALAQNFTIYYLDISNNNIKSDGIALIADRRIFDPTKATVEYVLKANNNQIGDDGAIALSKCNHSEFYAYRLELDNNQITDKGALALADNRSHYFYLSLNKNKLTPLGIGVLTRNDGLIELDVAENNLGDEGAIALTKSRSISYIDLSNNNITVTGANALAKLKQYIFSLYINDNNITDKGAIALLSNLEPMEHIGFAKNNLHDETAQALAKNSWEYLDIRNNHLSKAAVALLEQHRSSNTTVLTDGNDG